MLKGKNGVRYYLFALSNFLAAFGGGMILGKGMGTITTTFVQGGSLLAFFVGTVLGLFFLQLVPEKWSKTFAYSFSFCGSLTSFCLLIIFYYYSINEKISGMVALLFFFLLSIRFGFWFYSRVYRASDAAGQQQRIAWVEFGYYAGIIFGLIIWEFLGVNMSIALIIDAFLQFSAGSMDLLANHMQKSPASKFNKQEREPLFRNIINNKPNEKIWGWRLASAVVFLTIGTQVVTFSLAHQVSGCLGSYILAFFYIGVAIAAIICGKFKIRLKWDRHKDRSQGYPVICYHLMKSEKRISFFLMGILPLLGILIAVLGILLWRWSVLISGDNHILFNNREILLLIFVCIAAFFYEILALAIIDRIGLEEKFLNRSGMVVRTYGLMGMGAAVSLWMLGIIENSLFGLISILGVCLVFTMLAVWKRSPTYFEDQIFVASE